MALTITPDVYASTPALQRHPVAAYAADRTAKEVEIQHTVYDTVKALAEKKADAITDFYETTSVQYALIDNGKITVSGQAGVYSKTTSTALTKDNMYGIGSISKIFTTVAVMQLVEQGKVNLDDAVIKYITDFTMADSRYKKITVRMLLNHSSGLMGSTLNNMMLFNDNAILSNEQFLKSLKSQRLKADPGEFSVYCNDGFTLAQILIERVSGINFSEYVEKNISNTLSLGNTKTPLDNFNKDILAKTYLSNFKEAMPMDVLAMIGAGGMYSTAENLCSFAEIFMNNSTTNVLSASSVKAMENPEYLNGLWPKEGDLTFSYGLGWDSVNTNPFSEYGIKALAKGGDTSLYHGSLIVLPEQNIAMAVLSSGGSSTADNIMAQEVLLQALKSKGIISEIEENKTFSKPVKASMPDGEKEYAGIYANMVGLYEIKISDSGILTKTNMYQPYSGTQRYTYTGDGKFYDSDGSGYVYFVEEGNGNTYFYSSDYYLYPSLGQVGVSGYELQKLSDNKLSSRVKAQWDKREDKSYFIVNEKYSSQIYALGLPSGQVTILDGLESYLFNQKITDENNANAVLEIPGMYGRDLSETTFYKIGNIEYMKSGGSILISQDAVKTLSNKASFTCSIGADGYAKWYKIGNKSANRKIRIKMPAKSSSSVYDKNGNCTYNSMISKNSSVSLPHGGYIVFVGDKNSKFTVKYVK